MLNRKNKAFSILYFTLGLMVVMPSLARADCTSPASPAGRIEYFSAGEQVFKYCNGTSWIDWGSGGSGGGLWSDSGSGYIEYTSSLGGILVAPILGNPPPSGAVSSAGGAIDDLSDVDTSGKSTNDVLTWDGSAWGAAAGGGGGIWSDSGSGYIEYTSSLGGIVVAPVSGASPPAGAVNSAGGLIDDLGDVDTTGKSTNDVLTWDGSAWGAAAGGGGGLWSDSGTGYIQYTSSLGGILIGPISGNPAPGGAVAAAGGAIDDLSDVDTSGKSTNDVLTWDGSSWGAAAGGGGGGGLWSDTGNGYIEYTSALGGVLIGSATGYPAPSGAAGGSGGGGGGGVWFTSSTDIYYDTGNVGIGLTNPTVALDVSGDIHYTGTIVDVSDIRMKYDIKPLDSPLHKLSSLNGFSFKMKGDEKETIEYGVSAQDVQQAFPELVHQVDDNGTLGVAYDGLIAPMIEAIKELKAENETLKARLDAIEQQQKQTGEQ